MQIFYTKDKTPLPIEGSFYNQSVFLVVGGPSLSSFNLSLIKQPGIITMGVNNVAKVFRPNIWTLVDDVKNFMISVWKDPCILKLVPQPKHRHKLFDNTLWKEVTTRVHDCPNVAYFLRNEKFDHKTFLYEDTINWGNSKDNGGTRSVFLSAIRLLHVLGFKRVFLVGADFRMEHGKKNYAWDQDRSKHSVKNNNSTYKVLNERFDLLRPIFEKERFYIFNCTPNSGLKTFPYMPYSDAIKLALRDFPDVDNENVTGMYERKALEKEKAKRKK